MRKMLRVGCVAAAVLVAAPWMAMAQSVTTGSIAGVVRDATGAVLPGVSVEASSPALIEKVRTVVTDEQGNYKIVNLRPGVYAVTFTLPGFSTFRREGIELTTGFTATANAELKIGALEETVTVTGASPIVDVQNVRSQRVIASELLEALPVTKTLTGFAAITLGATGGVTGAGGHDVGGNKGENSNSISIHGSRSNDLKRLMDGMGFNSLQSSGGGVSNLHRVNMLAVQETVLESISNAESETGGVQLNYVPKDGGNRFAFTAQGAYADENFDSDNLSDELRARGLRQSLSIRKIWDAGAAVGGPIKRDRLWFFSVFRAWGAQEYVPGAFENKTLNTFFFTPDPTRPLYTDIPVKDVGWRLTWQAAAKHKITVGDNTQRGCLVRPATTVALEAMPKQCTTWGHLFQSTWSFPATSRLLAQAGMSITHVPMDNEPTAGLLPTSIAIRELSTGLSYGSAAPPPGLSDNALGHGLTSDNHNQRFSVSYITGSHAFKTGLYTMQGYQDHEHFVPQAISYTFRNQLPVSLTQWASPNKYRLRLRALGLYAQDQWTIQRLTLNLGIRFDRFRGYTLPETLPATRFAPARDFAAVDDVPNFKDVQPRLGAAYDLFGNGKTAIKGSMSRYVGTLGVAIPQANHPAFTLINNATRTWTDRNNDYQPECDLQTPGANGECGALDNALFGAPRVTTRYAPDAIEGFGAREFNWQSSLTMQHELRSGLGLNVGYFRTWYGNFTVIDNAAVTPSDFSQFCVNVPADSRLPGGGGNQLCGYYDVNPNRFGQVSNVITQIEDFGERTEVFNGIDVGMNLRFGEGGLLTGGVSFGRTQTTDCVVVDSPQLKSSDAFCNVTSPWSAGTQVKFSGAYPLPWGLQGSFAFQNLPGADIGANLVTTNAQVAPTLGRNLAAGPAGTVTVPIVPPKTMFEERLTQLDIRLTKQIRLGRARVQGMIDVYNLLNGATILAVNPTYGPAWLSPAGVMGSRFVKLGGQFDF